MALDPRTPVVVGVAAVNQKVEDPAEALEPLGLMGEALERAAADAGAPGLLAAADTFFVPRGFWEYPDPGRLLSERFGAEKLRTVVAEIGVLQTTLLGHAASAIAEGRSEIALIVGADARDRSSRFQRQGLEVPLTRQPACEPDQVLRPDAEIMGKLEVELGLVTPTIQYSMIDNALRAAEGQSIAEHRRDLGALWADFNRVAVANPDAWNRQPMSAEEIAREGPKNRMLSFPYTKWLVSQWNVNQGGALILCSLEKARGLGLDESRFVFPLAVVDSNHMVTLSERPEIHRSPGFRLAGEAAFAGLGLDVATIDHIELYSCFPAAVRVQQRELGIPSVRPLTQTGGMTFGGGPLNNFVIQSWVKMIERLRADPGSHGLVTAVSGLITKQGVSVFGPEPRAPFSFANVTEAAIAEHRAVDVQTDAEGRARVTTYTVSRFGELEQGLALICDFDDGRRTLRMVDDPDLAREATERELIGREVDLGPGGAVRWV